MSLVPSLPLLHAACCLPATARRGASSGGGKPAPAVFGRVLQGVARELQSRAAAAPLPTALQRAGSVKEVELRGVRRAPHSLAWEAFLEPLAGEQQGQQPPGSGSTVPGGIQEAVFLGMFPTQEAAGRAADLAAIRVHGEAVQTNFPRTLYQRHLANLAAHSSEAVIGALRKDALLSMSRTSKFKGVRRVGPAQFEARLLPALKRREGSPGAATAAALAGIGGGAESDSMLPYSLLSADYSLLATPVLPVVEAPGSPGWQACEQQAPDVPLLLSPGWDAQLLGQQEQQQQQ
ncbi:hypothetical protein D9Q98_006658 [Chlorella vulgaris]|uniref:AP2/ERF domain-containing protein n=1 Tax=Chlorella vulgaris TaxID=3077 RepID=A0A9D4YVG4_CHLVU|nr:hypothetical protein D9Q98_006658 [Chlorella vulgaris]